MIKIDAIHAVLSLLVAPEVVGNNDREPGSLFAEIGYIMPSTLTKMVHLL